MILWMMACATETVCVDGTCDTEIGTDGPGTTAIPEDRAGRCALFCEAEQTVCPSDVACLESCEDHCPTGPSEEEVVCAQNAAADGVECADFDCWGFCS